MEKARWNGRFTILRKNPYLVVDGAHNPDAAKKLQESLRMYFPDQEFVFLMGVFRDKQYDAIAKRMAPMAKEIVAMETPDNPRALPAEKLGEVLEKISVTGTCSRSRLFGGSPAAGGRTGGKKKM